MKKGDFVKIKKDGYYFPNKTYYKKGDVGTVAYIHNGYINIVLYRDDFAELPFKQNQLEYATQLIYERLV